MTDPLDTRLDQFERRLHELESELDSLRRLAAADTLEAEPTPAPLVEASPVESARLRPPVAETPSARAPAGAPLPTVAPPAWIAEELMLARQRVAGGDARGALKALERARAKTFGRADVEALEAILQVTRGLPTSAPDALRGRAGRLEYALEQNIRFLRRKRGLAETPTSAAPAAPLGVEATAPTPSAAPVPTRAPLPSTPSPRAVVPAPSPPHAPPPPRRPSIQLPELDMSDLLGPRALALAGGVVTLLGIVFFFVLAVNRGWIGPVGRVGLGAGASLLVFTAGFELRRRYGDAHSALAAVAVGISGGYITVLAAAALYDLLPNYAALVAAASIAAVGVATSIGWRSQIIAGLGLIGAMLMPVAVIAQSGLSVLGTAFVAVVLGATSIVAISRRWRELLVAGVVVSLPQIAALAAQSQYHTQSSPRIVALAAVFSLLYLATGVVYQLRLEGQALQQISTSLITIGGLLAAASAIRLIGSPRDEGIALLAITLVYAVLAGALSVRRATRDLSAFLAAIGLTLAAIALADLLSGQPLAYAWAAEAAALAWLARRVRELRYQVWSGIYVLLALGHVLILDAPPTQLLIANDHPAAGAATAVALAVAAVVFAIHARPWDERFVDRGGLYGLFAAFFSALEDAQGRMRSGTLWAAGVLGAYAASLGTLSLFSSFEWGHVAVAALLTLIGLGIVFAGLRRDNAELRLGALIWLGISSSGVVVHSAESLTGAPRSWSYMVVAAALLAAGLAYQLLHKRPKGSPMDVSAGLAAIGVGLGAIASAGILGGQPLAYAWAAETAALAWLARRTSAPHLQALSIGTLGLALAHVLALDAPPSHLLKASAHPAHGMLTAVGVAIAAGFLAWRAREKKDGPDVTEGRYVALTDLDASLARNRRHVRDTELWLAGVVATYAASLGTLALFSSFDWGHVAVAALWSSLALAVVLAGLRRGSAQLWNGGLVGLAFTIVAVVVHGEIELASTPRSWSFLVLAAAALAAGHAYQLMQRGPTRLEPITVVLILTGLGLSVDPIIVLLRDTAGAIDPEGGALLGLAGLYGLISASVFRRSGQRDYGTLLWTIALVVGAAAAGRLFDGTFLVLAWAAAGTILSWLSARAREPRFLLGAAGSIVLALAHAVIVESPPTHLFSARVHPGSGAPAVLLVAAAMAVLARYLIGESDALRRGRASTWWLAGVLAVFGLSLAILDLVQRAFPHVSLQTSFQRGHTAVSAFWGLLGLALLYAGLKRWRALRLAGLAVLGISLAKIFLYDLPSLSSITRALSFLAVGAVLLLGGFFYQRLSSTLDEKQPDASP